jgi:uncharacterized protein YchJ
MNVYENWMKMAYNERGLSEKKLWDDYIPREQKIYEYILSDKVTELTGTVAELAERFDMRLEYIVGFVDGIKDALINADELEPKELTADTRLNIKIDFEKLYKKMVEYKADHLYSLPQWEGIFDAETLKRFYTEQKHSGTYTRVAEKVGRNDPCPCGSGKKYKKCCGVAASAVASA